MLLVLDNYDSFTYNLVQYFGELGAEPWVVRNDAVTLAQIAAARPAAIVISPGPGAPEGAGISEAVISRFAGECPILGVCLGHQAIAEAFGGRVVRANRPMHGKTSPVAHHGSGLFAGLPNPLDAMRYHSLLVDPASLPPELEITAWTADPDRGEEIMGLRHRTHVVFGVQFHPESVGTAQGKRLLANFLDIVRRPAHAAHPQQP